MIQRCRAYMIADLPPNPEFERALTTWQARPDLVYVWEDHAVTALPLRDREPVFVSGSIAWREYCSQLLSAIDQDTNPPGKDAEG